MRILRLLPLFLLFSIPVLAQTGTSAQGDPQALTVVQAAIAAMGGANAIGQVDDWDLQALLEGPLETGNRAENIRFQVPNASVNGNASPAPKYITSSLFVPALLGAILLQESRDSNYSVRFDGSSTLASKPVTVVTFLSNDSQSIAQIWAFDTATRLPARVFFDSPAQIGLTQSFRALIDVSDYRAISGVLHPFRIVTYMGGRPPQVLNLQSLTARPSASTNQPGTPGGAQ
jgi:hypothetical protein